MTRHTQDVTADRLLRCAAVFLPAALPRDGRIAFWAPGPGTGEDLAGPDVDTEAFTFTELTVVERHGTDGVRTRIVPAVALPVADAVPLLARARHRASAHPATRAWGAAALHALTLVARGRILPGLTSDGHDAWRAGPRDAEDIAHLRAVAASMPPEGHAVPLDGTPLRVPEPRALLGAFLDAVADT